MALSREKIASKISKIAKKQNSTENGGTFPKCSFLPEGSHVLRIITDPSDEIMIDFYSRGYFANGIRDTKNIDKSDLPENFEDELAEVSKKLSEFGIYKYNAKYNCLIYAWLIKTDAKSERWEPNNLYCIIGDRALSKSIQSFLVGLNANSPGVLDKMINPSEYGIAINVDYKRGEGKGIPPSCNIQPYLDSDFQKIEIDPINFEGQGYSPLEVSYIKPGFDEEKYTKLLNKAKEDLKQKEEYSGKRKSETITESASKEETISVKKQEDKKLKEHIKPNNDKKDKEAEEEEDVWTTLSD